MQQNNLIESTHLFLYPVSVGLPFLKVTFLRQTLTVIKTQYLGLWTDKMLTDKTQTTRPNLHRCYCSYVVSRVLPFYIHFEEYRSSVSCIFNAIDTWQVLLWSATSWWSWDLTKHETVSLSRDQIRVNI